MQMLDHSGGMCCHIIACGILSQAQIHISIVCFNLLGVPTPAANLRNRLAQQPFLEACLHGLLQCPCSTLGLFQAPPQGFAAWTQ